MVVHLMGIVSVLCYIIHTQAILYHSVGRSVGHIVLCSEAISFLFCTISYTLSLDYIFSMRCMTAFLPIYCVVRSFYCIFQYFIIVDFVCVSLCVCVVLYNFFSLSLSFCHRHRFCLVVAAVVVLIVNVPSWCSVGVLCVIATITVFDPRCQSTQCNHICKMTRW